MKKILSILALATGLCAQAQYNGLTTIYKVGETDFLVDITNYNEHYLRQDLADQIFSSYFAKIPVDSGLSVPGFLVKGKLKVREDSPKTVVLFYECEEFLEKKSIPRD